MRGYFKPLVFGLIICYLKLGLCLKTDDVCKETGFCHYPNTSTGSCFCQDDNCWLYGDCCRNVEAKMNSVKNIETSCGKIPNTKPDVYIANSCPPSWTDENVYLLCKKNVSQEYYNYILDVPFLSNVTNILYSNIYCARCNNDDLYLNKLLAYLYCTSKNFCDINTILGSTYDAGELRWFPNTNFISSIKLIVDVKPLRKCRNVIRKCATNWTEFDVLEKCMSYAHYVENSNKKMYHNAFCAECNYEKITDLKCVERSKLLGGFGIDIPSFSTLIDFSAPNKLCSSVDELHDPVTDGCQPTFCGVSYEKLKGKCVPKNRYARQDDLNNTTVMKSCSAVVAQIEDLVFLSNGSVFYNKTEKIYAPDEYEMMNSVTYLLCADESHQYHHAWAFSHAASIVSVVCLVVSVVCLLVHIIMRLIVEDLTRIAEKNLLNLSVSLFIAQFLYILGMFDSIREMHDFCYIAAIFTHFFYLVVFFWMNVIAFDIHCRFHKFQSKSNHKRTFNLYLSYAWLSPLVIVIIAIIADQTHLFPSLQPNYGNGVCWISRKHALFIFFALPLALLLIVNCVLFVLTAYNIRKTVKMTQNVTKLSDRKLYFVYVKLAFIMGGTWIFGFAANLIDFEPLWYIFIVLNASQGFFLFIAFRSSFRSKRRKSSTTGAQMYTKISSFEKSAEKTAVLSV